jgi:GLPGLI family protein
MKTTLSLVRIQAVIFFVLCVFAGLNAQDFEGRIDFEIKNEGTSDPRMSMMLPKKSAMYVKNGNIRMEMDMAMGMKSASITDGKSGSSVTLMDMMGQKYAIESGSNDELIKKQQEKMKVAVNQTGEQKTIAGYPCQKAVVTFTDTTTAKETALNVWYTNDIKIGNKHVQGPFASIEGSMLEYSISQQGFSMQFTATKVVKQPVDDTKFEIPTDYKRTTQEELMRMFGGR